jgi:lipoprotein-anchoring transpeptidase ErfK/SrfK
MIRVFIVPAVAVLLGLVLGACASDPRWARGDSGYLGASAQTGAAPLPGSVDSVSFWDGEGVKGASRIEIRLSDQRAYFYKGDILVGVSAISSGKEGFDTPPGNYKIMQKDKDHRSTLYGEFVDIKSGAVINDDVDIKVDKVPKGAKFLGAPMPNFMRVVGGVGMHAGYLPGVAASHGCIRMPLFMSENFFSNVQIGTPVTVVR